MPSRHVQEREDRKTLDLLRFALLRTGVEQHAWQIAPTFDALQPCDDCTCLYGEQGQWIVAHTERGLWRELGRFLNTFEASKYFYANFHPGPSPYDLRECWESETGQQFSMME